MKKINLLLCLLFTLVLTGCGEKPEAIDYSSIKVPSDMAPALHEYNFKFKAEEFARMDGALEALPVVEQYAMSILHIQQKDVGNAVKFTDAPINNLINKQDDIVISTRPTEEEQQQAKAVGIELENTPVFNDAFVFITGKYNKINGLSSEQIKRIYSGEIKNWKDVGGFDSRIYLQSSNDENLKNIMTVFMTGKKKIISATKEQYSFGADSKLTGVTASDLTGVNSIAYTSYSKFNQSLIKDDMKMLTIDGIAPTADNIKSKKYPQTIEYFAITRMGEEPDSLGYRLRAFALCPAAQKIATTLGFIGI